MTDPFAGVAFCLRFINCAADARCSLIHDWRTCLKGDVVEALQVIKCLLRNDLIFREPEPQPCSLVEIELEAGEREDTADTDDMHKKSQWDLVLDDNNDDI